MTDVWMVATDTGALEMWASEHQAEVRARQMVASGARECVVWVVDDGGML